MTTCARCNRPLRNPPVDGMGPVCAAKARAALPVHERDLFGYDLDQAEAAARAQVQAVVLAATVRARDGLRREIAAARRRLEVRP